MPSCPLQVSTGVFHVPPPARSSRSAPASSLAALRASISWEPSALLTAITSANSSTPFLMP